MKQIFKVENVKCEGCANTLKKKLLNKFGEVDVNLGVMPREVILDIKDNMINELRNALISLGYPMSNEDISTIDGIKAKAKSFISCATGKL